MADELVTCGACGTKNASNRTVCLSCGGDLSLTEDLNTPTKQLRKRLRMNDKQRAVLILAAIVILAMLLYPPFDQIGYRGQVWGIGYSWIFKPPYGPTKVDTGLLLIQWIGVLIVGAIAYFFFMDR